MGGAISLMCVTVVASGVTAAAEPVGVTVPDSKGGDIAVWGDDDDFYGVRHLPIAMRGKKVVAIDASAAIFSVAVASDGSVAAWGEGGTDVEEIPASLAGRRVTAVAAGYGHCLALTSDGAVTAWGNNSRGQAVVPSVLQGQRVKAIAAGRFHSLALTTDGAVVAWGSNEYGQVSPPPSLDGRSVTTIAAGDEHSLAVTGDGAVVAWGSNEYGQRAVPSSLAGRAVTMVDGGGEHSLALTSDGRVTAWGQDLNGQSTVPPSVARERVAAVAAGSLHSMVLTERGQVLAWGYDAFGQSSVPSTMSGRRVTAIATGFLHSMAIVGPPAPVPSAATIAAPSPPRVVTGTRAGRTFVDRTRRQVIVRGRATPGALVTVLEGSRAWSRTRASSSGAWRAAVGPMRAGRHDLRAVQVVAGRSSAPSAVTRLVVVVPEVRISKRQHPTARTRPTLRGRGDPGARIVVRKVGGRILGVSHVRASGRWSLSSRTLRRGTYRVRAIQSIAGTTTRSNVVTLRVRPSH